MAKNFRHMCRQQSCEKLPRVRRRSLFFSHKSFLHFRKHSRWKTKDLPKKQHECPAPLDPPPTQFVPLPHFTPTKMSDYDAASNSNSHLSLVQILGDANLKLDFNLPNWLFLHISSKYRTFKAFKKDLAASKTFSHKSIGSCRWYMEACVFCTRVHVCDSLCQMFPFALLIFLFCFGSRRSTWIS